MYYVYFLLLLVNSILSVFSIFTSTLLLPSSLKLPASLPIISPFYRSAFTFFYFYFYIYSTFIHYHPVCQKFVVAIFCHQKVMGQFYHLYHHLLTFRLQNLSFLVFCSSFKSWQDKSILQNNDYWIKLFNMLFIEHLDYCHHLCCCLTTFPLLYPPFFFRCMSIRINVHGISS